MKLLKTTIAALLAVSSVGAMAANTDQDVRQLKSNDAPDLSSGKAYFFYDTLEAKYDIFFLRSMTSEEVERFAANRTVALAEARAKLREKRDGAPGISDEELLPDAAFDFVDDTIRNLARMDSGRVYEKDGERRTYAVEVPPGEYTIYAAGIDGFTSGTCMCMGTVRFDAKAGEAVDLGAILVAPENGDTDIAELAPYEAPEYIRRKALPYKMSVRPARSGEAVPALFSNMSVVPARYAAAEDHLPNYMGMMINRMAPIEGVLSYDFDRVVATSSGGMAQANIELDVERQAMADAEANMEAAADAVEDATD